MNILLDTHIAIWAITDDRRLSKNARDYLLDPGNNIYYSAASVLEGGATAFSVVMRAVSDFD